MQGNSNRVRWVVLLLASVVILSRESRLRADGDLEDGAPGCLKCLSSWGCYQSCNCKCDNGNTPYATGCDSAGYPIYCCATSQNPGMNGACISWAHCDNSACPPDPGSGSGSGSGGGCSNGGSGCMDDLECCSGWCDIGGTWQCQAAF
jgi:hypothetical protein